MTRCTCGREMVEITLATPDAPVRLRSCSHCDRLDWFVGDTPRTREDALEQLATTGRR